VPPSDSPMNGGGISNNSSENKETHPDVRKDLEGAYILPVSKQWLRIPPIVGIGRRIGWFTSLFLLDTKTTRGMLT